ncbi:MAG: hypothetical protein M3122_07620 [Actinomycetota bacterium]|nr:hypothetical protein [Actinomycetota bacterium]
MTRIVAETFTRMVKRPLVLMAVLAAMLAAVAVPAFAQQGPTTTTATGVLVGPVDDGDQDPTPEYRLTDEATGTNYVLISGFVELEPFAGQRVTIAGVPIGGADNAPPALNVTQIELADEDEDPSPSDKATLSFELTVDGDPPAGTVFSGNVRTGEGGPGLFVPLTDPDEDRVYTGSTTVDRFGPGPRPVPPGVEPVSFPVRIVQDSSEVIKDFGTVKLDGDKTFEASVSFPVDDCPIISPTPEQCGDGSDDGSTDDGSDDNAGSGGSSGGSNSGGSVADSGSSDSGGSGNDAEGSGSSGRVTSGVKGLLPSTGGGMALTVLVAGVLLIGGGLLIRRLVR